MVEAGAGARRTSVCLRLAPFKSPHTTRNRDLPKTRPFSARTCRAARSIQCASHILRACSRAAVQIQRPILFIAWIKWANGLGSGGYNLGSACRPHRETPRHPPAVLKPTHAPGMPCAAMAITKAIPRQIGGKRRFADADAADTRQEHAVAARQRPMRKRDWTKAKPRPDRAAA